jgi:hypothetical protein
MHTASQASPGLVRCLQFNVLRLAGAACGSWGWPLYRVDEACATSLHANSAPPECLVAGADAWIGVGF